MTPDPSLQKTGWRTVRRRLAETLLAVVAGLGLAAAGTAVAELAAWLLLRR